MTYVHLGSVRICVVCKHISMDNPASGVLVVVEIRTYLSLILSPALLCRSVPVQACTHLPVCSATAPATL